MMELEALVRQLREAGVPAQTGEPMARHTTLRLGGPAEVFCEPASEAEIAAALRVCRAAGVLLCVIGNGSNLLVRDGGVRGVVMRIGGAFAGARWPEENVLDADAGLSLAQAARMAAERGLGGLAFASGIPGTVAGGVMMNAGAYGGEMADVVEEVRGLTPSGEAFTLRREALGFGYRTSALQAGGRVITGVRFRLTPSDAEEERRKIAELSEKRREKQPVDKPSAGSTFKRPAGAFAAALIDQCGLKGARVGGASVSEKHAGFLINEGASAADFLALMQLVRDRVLRETGFGLEPEVRILGEDGDREGEG